MPRYVLTIAGICIIVIGITYLIHRFAGRKKYVKYIPAGIFIILAIYNMYLLKTNPGEGFGDIIKALSSFISFACFISGVGTGLILDFMLPKIKKKR